MEVVAVCSFPRNTFQPFPVFGFNAGKRISGLNRANGIPLSFRLVKKRKKDTIPKTKLG